jgi:hypothetical protein
MAHFIQAGAHLIQIQYLPVERIGKNPFLVRILESFEGLRVS